ncbi:pyruvate dehydrogenase E1 component subunit alpha-3, chloroplastic-like protein [Tanacetum coccineum]
MRRGRPHPAENGTRKGGQNDRDLSCYEDDTSFCGLYVAIRAYHIRFKVKEVAMGAISRARRGEGSTLVECETYRFKGYSLADPYELRDPAFRPMNVALLVNQFQKLMVSMFRLNLFPFYEVECETYRFRGYSLADPDEHRNPGKKVVHKTTTMTRGSKSL